MTLQEAALWLRTHDFDSCDCHDGERGTKRSLDWLADELDTLALKLKSPPPTTEVEAARAAVKGVGKLRQMLESTEFSRKSLEKVLLDLAPFVAALSRAPNVSPDARKALLAIEPEMLRVLGSQPKEPL